MGKPKVITISTREATLKKRLRSHLKSLGFTKSQEGLLVPPGSSKDVIRAIHSVQRDDRLAANDRFISARFAHLSNYFASGNEIDPARISPVLQLVSSKTWETELFRLASLTWSVPVSNGFGRRLRYLVWDSYNGKLIGIIAIGDPVFNLSVRDNFIKWDVKGRGQRLVNVMDAYVLGAVPPYNALLGGKLVACLIRSREIYHDFTRAYGQTRGIISKKRKNARLLAVTTSSSMGRSSVYNRLKLGGMEYFKPIGYTVSRVTDANAARASMNSTPAGSAVRRMRGPIRTMSIARLPSGASRACGCAWMTAKPARCCRSTCCLSNRTLRDQPSPPTTTWKPAVSIPTSTGRACGRCTCARIA